MSGEERIREDGEMAKNIEGGRRNNWKKKTGRREKNGLKIREGGYFKIPVPLCSAMYI